MGRPAMLRREHAPTCIMLAMHPNLSPRGRSLVFEKTNTGFANKACPPSISFASSSTFACSSFCMEYCTNHTLKSDCHIFFLADLRQYIRHWLVLMQPTYGIGRSGTRKSSRMAFIIKRGLTHYLIPVNFVHGNLGQSEEAKGTNPTGQKCTAPSQSVRDLEGS
ncbi:hypothetical protein EJ08DRAFT_421773 [Tothia fuscella]|uniref:Uncharacterized protein n=1 Tax=Tothia fuscella TaxID=1048955 RepID=A0A9P4NJJ1_9PEZI|nr:hypothetical protein EJ08DRAFT_421773 [Tothia fuscella]